MYFCSHKLCHLNLKLSDINECIASPSVCHVNAQCTNTIGSYRCTCNSGYTGDGKTCSDIDECSIANECHQNATCHNTKGSYNCTCNGGFKGDGRLNCTEHTLQDSVIIGDNQTYFGMLSNWLKPVVQVNGQWILCWRASLHGWATATFHSLCNNKGPTVTIVKDTNNSIFGGYTSISWETSLLWKNDSKAFLFSLKNPTNNPRKLLQIDNKSLYSVDHYVHYGPSFGRSDLLIRLSPNRSRYSSENLGYTYTVPSGKRSDPFLTGNNRFIASEIETFYETTQTRCSSWPCKNKGKCLPFYGENNYMCLCRGFKGKTEKTTVKHFQLDRKIINVHLFPAISPSPSHSNVDECSSENECHVDATCTNTKGTYNCICQDGFEGDGKNCTDIDECSCANECHLDGTRTNTKGSYNCTCQDGFEGDGKNCTHIDECSLENDCHLDATCDNTKGSYDCTCKDGFEGDGRNNWADIDECSTETECHYNASCKNTKGSYICTCQDGLEGDDGEYCTADPECHSYIVNKETDRSVMFVNNGSSHLQCDRTLAAGWYRFNSTAGSKMPHKRTDVTHMDQVG
ncbi:PREDICTED: fibrillin-1-like [Acropora digitifera]|uniref:fibrillin-1-like n=1 Tax=Acropora digitifera TaxID=70779 RepID=UPI00077A9CB3|nr:PREDICTED: fibrillin-1-like [Acropora digitifera]